MKEQVAKRLDQLKNGQKVDKSDQILEEVVEELKSEGLYVSNLKKRKTKKSKKAEEEAPVAAEEEAAKPKKKKKSLVE
jgi:hypothetical protein